MGFCKELYQICICCNKAASARSLLKVLKEIKKKSTCILIKHSKLGPEKIVFFNVVQETLACSLSPLKGKSAFRASEGAT